MKELKVLTNDELIKNCLPVVTKSAHKSRSDKYSFISSLDAVNILKDDGWLPVQASQRASRVDGTKGFGKHMIRFSKPELITPENRMDLVMFNSHDGGSAFQLFGGIYRLVCSNGMMVGKTLLSYSHRHIGFNADKFIESAKFILTGLDKVQGSIENWRNVNLDQKEMLDFAEVAMDFALPKRPFEPEKLLEYRRPIDKENNLWTVYNVIQENIIKGGINGTMANGRRMTTRAVKNIERDQIINQTLWDMAEETYNYKIAA